MARNTVTVTVDDHSKQLRFSETLTTGSCYDVTIAGGATVCGALARLTVMTREGQAIAVASLVDGVGALDLSTDEARRLSCSVRRGTVLVLDAVLKCLDIDSVQNAGYGPVAVVAIPEPSTVRGIFDGQTMGEYPTQHELTDTVKQIFTAFGGKVVKAVLPALALFATVCAARAADLSGPIDAAGARLWWDVPPTNELATVAKSLGLGPRRYAFFTIDVNCTTNGCFSGFELKATTNNFDEATEEDVRLQFYAQSEIADTGVTNAVDRMALFVCTSHNPTNHDVRAYTRVPNTIEFPHHLTRVAVLVDVSCLERHKDGDWLREDNEELIWCYLRSLPFDPPFEREKGTRMPLWHPIAPVRWYRELPYWAAAGAPELFTDQPTQEEQPTE